MKLISNSFTQYELTTEEQLQSTIFTELQLANIQNQIAQLSLEKIGLEFDPLNPQQFIQAEAEKRGNITALQWLLSQHEDSVTRFNQMQQSLNTGSDIHE